MSIVRALLSVSCLVSLLCCTGRTGVQPLPRMAEGVLDLQDTVTLGLERLPEAEMVIVHRSDGYVNNVLLTHFCGEYYCMWQASGRDEDTPDTRVLYARSRDGVAWGEPGLLAAPTDSTFVSPGGWIRRGDSLAAVLNYVCAPDRSKGGTAWYSTTRDGTRWSAPQPVRMADGTPVDGIFEQDPLPLPSGRTVGAVHFRPGLTPVPVYTDAPSALEGWTRSRFPEGKGKPLEPSQYRLPDGTLVMFFRDQASSFVKLASLSTDEGESWTAPAATDIPDSRSKQCAGNLPDGRAFWVGNPTGNKSRRALVLAVSADGLLFDQAWLLAGPSDLPARCHDGRYKTLGYSYPKAVLLNNSLWISFSINKEDAALIRIPVDRL